MSKDSLFKIIIAIYIGAAIFRLTDPTLKWFKTSNQPASIPVNIVPPTEITIPSLSLDLKISPSIVKGNDWQLFDDKVAWLSTSALPGKGNTILYAHDRPGLFGDLYKLKINDVIEIYDGKWNSYKVSEVHKVLPTDIDSVFGDKNRLTLYTCIGSFDQKRLVVYAE